MSSEKEVRALYERLIRGWNDHDAAAMAAPVAADGLVIGYDGSQMPGRDAVESELGAVFADHETASYVVKVRSVVPIGDDGAVLHAVAGMIPPGGSELMEERNQIQTVVGRRTESGWEVVLFQTTPARFDGRPELSRELTEELSQVAQQSA
jgi:uncharacterized protein (TIGR02246 family)